MRKPKAMYRTADGRKNILGDTIRQLRQQRNMMQKDLAECLEKYIGTYADQKFVSSIERGSRTITDFELLAIAKCLGVTVDEMFSYAPAVEIVRENRK